MVDVGHGKNPSNPAAKRTSRVWKAAPWLRAFQKFDPLRVPDSHRGIVGDHIGVGQRRQQLADCLAASHTCFGLGWIVGPNKYLRLAIPLDASRPANARYRSPHANAKHRQANRCIRLAWLLDHLATRRRPTSQTLHHIDGPLQPCPDDHNRRPARPCHAGAAKDYRKSSVGAARPPHCNVRVEIECAKDSSYTKLDGRD